MRVSALAAIGIAASTLLGQALAACPVGHPSVDLEFAKSAIVATGKVTAEARAAAPFDGMYEGNRYSFRPAQILKGQSPRTLSLFSENSTGRFPMEVGETYLVFVYVAEHKGAQFFAVDNCGNSGRLADIGATVQTVRELKRARKH
jgi:hypothetical protein